MGEPRTLVFTAAAPSLTDSTITAEVPELEPGGQTTVTVTLVDPYGNPVPGAGDALDIVVTSGPATVGPITDNGDGTYTTTVTADPNAEPGLEHEITLAFRIGDEQAEHTTTVIVFAPAPEPEPNPAPAEDALADTGAAPALGALATHLLALGATAVATARRPRT